MNDSQNSDQEPARVDRHNDQSGVLLSDQICYYADRDKMITPFDRSELRAAGYHLHVGDEFMIAGRRHNFEKQKIQELTIEPYEVAVIKIKEQLCLPRFLIGRWNIEVLLAYKGLMWVGGAQVDPGFKGNLMCPIYNLSDRAVRLKKGERLAVIDFVKTTLFTEGLKEFRTAQKENRDFKEYGADQLESALVKPIDDIEDIKAKVESVENRMTLFTTIVISALGLLVASEFIKVPKIDWLVVLLVLGVVLLVSVSRTLLLYTVGRMRWVRRSLNVESDVFLRFQRIWAWCFGTIAIIVFAVLLYIVFAHPLSGLPDEAKNLDRRVKELEQVLKGVQKDAKESKQGEAATTGFDGRKVQLESE